MWRNFVESSAKVVCTHVYSPETESWAKLWAKPLSSKSLDNYTCGSITTHRVGSEGEGGEKKPNIYTRNTFFHRTNRHSVAKDGGAVLDLLNPGPKKRRAGHRHRFSDFICMWSLNVPTTTRLPFTAVPSYKLELMVKAPL